ncbi:hypothetical protein KP509_15G039300 [Ceratopteris richardii]|nr:hypothetical protein KP509_15G039300 [Ceratopteris richardii]
MKDDCSSISDGSQTSAAPLLVVQPHEDAITSDSLQNTESANFSCFTDIESLDVPVASQVQCASKYTSSSTKISRGTELLLHKSKNALGACPEAARSLQNASNLHCGEISHGLLTYSVLSQSQGNQDTQIGENVREGHTVVFFSPQKYLQENAAKCNTDNFSNLYSIYILYYHNIMCWIKRTFGKKAITRQVHRLKQIFSPSSRGFVYLDSQKSPKFPHNATYSKKKMANDDELRAVLLKINDVLTSMDRDSVVSDLARKCKIEHQTS